MIKKQDVMNNIIYEKIIIKNKNYILRIMKKNNINKKYNVVIVLGSGLKDMLGEMQVDFEIPYSKMPYIPASKVKGHDSKFIFGTFQNQNIIAMSGRVHFYEGYSPREVTLAIRVLSKMGVESAILTNSAGGINEGFRVGDVMIIKDHINMTSSNPLIGENLESFGERFPSLLDAWNKSWREKIKNALLNTNIVLREGVYTYNVGASYETPAEIEMLRKMGADAVGMSTVFECIAAVHSKMKVVGFSVITNKCGEGEVITHGEVLLNAEKSKNTLKEILKIAINESEI